MIVFTQIDPITVLNHVNANHPDWAGNFNVVLGINRARGRTAERLFVFESPLVIDALSGVKPQVVDTNGKVDWCAVGKYMHEAPPDLTVYDPIKIVPNRIVAELANKEVDPDHALSAMASVFRYELRPQVVAEIVKFLSDRRTKFFSLPRHLTPQRGKVRALYDKASTHDYSKLKAAIASPDESYFEATYWRAVIKAHNGEPAKTKRGR